MKKLLTFLMAAILISALAGCQEKNEEVFAPSSAESAESSKPVSSAESEESQPEEIQVIDSITGEIIENEIKTRPIAIMVNNVKAALPQRGIAEAGIIYELPVEGGATRLMAVFSDYAKLPEVGSIRSLRHDFAELACGMNAFIVHFGWSDSAKEFIETNDIATLNGILYADTAFYMDGERAKTKISEHCWFTTKDLMAKGIEKVNADISIETSSPIFSFAENLMVGGAAAEKVTATVVSGSKTDFYYNESGKYTKTQSGSPHIDELTGEKLEFDNIFLMYTDISNMADGYHKEIALENGEGYYISKGLAVKVSFKKDGINGKMQVLSEDGKEIAVNSGKSYFCVMDKSNMDKLVME